MLGDAGANAGGVLAGWLLVVALVAWWWALAAYVLFALALNIASERISFSAVISRTPMLRWLDGLGMQDGPPEGAGDSRKIASGGERATNWKLAPHLNRATARIGSGSHQDTVGTERELGQDSWRQSTSS